MRYMIVSCGQMQMLLELSLSRVPTEVELGFVKRIWNSSATSKMLMNQFGVAVVVGVGYGLFISLGGRAQIRNEGLQTGAEILDQVTRVAFPERIHPALDGKPYRLVALGPRCVTFLQFTAYAVALYVHVDDLASLLDDKGWQVSSVIAQLNWDFYCPDKFLKDAEFAEACIGWLLRRNLRFALTIGKVGEFNNRPVPVKSSSGTHLKGGLTRSLLAQLTAQRQRLLPAEVSAIEASILEFGQTFPKAPIPIYAKLHFVRELERGDSGDLALHLRVVNQKGADKGTLHHPWVAENLLRIYVSGHPVISPRLGGDLPKP
ncbi:hypothetical protein L0F63_006434 [Massospora cicadina]|nr:hypothetical protein L0F63_006434 [Massospora cicadina]